MRQKYERTSGYLSIETCEWMLSAHIVIFASKKFLRLHRLKLNHEDKVIATVQILHEHPQHIAIFFK
jgi:hypothetical protein